MKSHAVRITSLRSSTNPPDIPGAITHNPPGSCARLEVTYGPGMMHCLVTSLTFVKHVHKKKNAMCFHMLFVRLCVCVCEGVGVCVCDFESVGVGVCTWSHVLA